jgi:hypothetical protein
MLHDLWDLRRRASCALAAALLAGLLLQLHVLLIATLFTAGLAMLVPRAGASNAGRKYLRAAALGCGLLSLGLLLVFGCTVVRALRAGDVPGRLASVLLQNPDDARLRFDGLRDVWRLGIDHNDSVDAQLWIKEHSRVDETIFPPGGTARGWQIFSERSYVFTGSLYTYTHLSKDFALRYEGFLKRLPSGENVSWREMVQFGRQEGADWIIVDDRTCRRRQGDPTPQFSAGPYHVFRAAR